MVPEGKDNIKGQAWFGCTRISLLLEPIRTASSRIPRVSPWPVTLRAYVPTRVGAMRCAGGGGKMKPSCRNNAMRDVTMACIDTTATSRRSSSTTASLLLLVLLV